MHRQVVFGEFEYLDALGFGTVGDAASERPTPRGDGQENIVGILPGSHVVHRWHWLGYASIRKIHFSPDRDEAIRIRVGQRTQHCGVDDAEERRGRSDAESQCQDRDDRPATRARQLPDPVSDVL